MLFDEIVDNKLCEYVEIVYFYGLVVKCCFGKIVECCEL